MEHCKHPPKIDTWAGFLDKETLERIRQIPKRKILDEKKFVADLDMSTLRNSTNDSWIYMDPPNIRLNYKKCIPKSHRALLNRWTEEELKESETFIIRRGIYRNQIDHICQYLDYFTEFYDDEKELMTVYIHIKKAIDGGPISLSAMEFKTILLKRLFDETNIINNVKRMVDDNYYIDSTVDKKTGRVFDKPDEFTNNDIKVLMVISIIFNLIIVPTEHYMATNTLYDKKDPIITTLISNLFEIMFDRIANSNSNELAETLKIKLYLFVLKRVYKHYQGNQALWEQQEALRGTTQLSKTDTILVKYILADNFFKLHFKHNMNSFLKGVINTQLLHSIEQEKLEFTPIHISTDKRGPDNLSGVEKTEQMALKLDESQTIRIYKSLSDMINNLEQKYGYISEEEINFYMVYLEKQDKFHGNLVNYHFAKRFNGFAELKSASLRQCIKFVIYAKRELSAQGYTQLQWLVSSLLIGKSRNRMLQDAKFLAKIKTSSVYRHLMEDKYSVIDDIDQNPILQMISTVITNQFAFIEYDQPELTGEKIIFNNDIVSDELLVFIDNI